MILKIDTTSSTPIYAQIVEQVKRAIVSKALKNGDILPSLRETAIKLRVNPLTVDKAYKLLEHNGLIETRHGLGSFVTVDVDLAADGFRRDVLTKAVDDLLIDAYNLGASIDELKDLLEERAKVVGDGFAADIPERRNDKDGR